MNIINKTLLNTFLLPKFMYRQLGVNTTQLRSIVYTKLTIDDRRPSSLIQSQQARKKPLSSATIGTMVISFFMGLFYLTAFMYSEDAVTAFTIYFSMFFLMLSASLISDFTSVLIDIRDTFIILPKPVNDRTFVVSRLLHITIHICKIILPMTLPGSVYMVIDYGIGGLLAFWFTVILLTLFVIFFINAVYLLILKITTPQKFQSIISYLQIIFAVAIYASYQIMPRIMDSMETFHTQLSDNAYVLVYPLYWFAAAWSVLTNFSGSSNELMGAGLALVLPLLGIWIVIKFLAPSFNNKLAMIQGAGSDAPVKAKQKTQKQSGSYSGWLGRIFTSSAGEKAGFLFAWKMMSRSRDFKLKVYPAIGYLLVYVVIIFFNSRSIDLSTLTENSGKAKIFIIMGLYFGSLVLNMSLSQLVYSEKYKASWVYFVAPLQIPGQLLSGAIKAAIAVFYLPMVVFIATAGLYLLGISVLPNIVLGLFNQLLISYLIVYMNHRRFPFSVLQQNDQRTGSFMRGIATLLISITIATVHYFVYSFTLVVVVFAVLSMMATWLLTSSIKNTSWSQIKSSYVEE